MKPVISPGLEEKSVRLLPSSRTGYEMANAAVPGPSLK